MGPARWTAVSQFEFSVVKPLATSAAYMSGDLKGPEVPQTLRLYHSQVATGGA